MHHESEYRPLADTDILVSPVSLGCWPIAGMTSLDVNDTDSLATLEAAVANGVNFLDTAYCYGANGESERLIARALGHRRDEIVIATKGGIHWDAEGKQVLDGRPDTLRRECEESLKRLQTDRVELLYLHGPDPATPVAESAGALKELMEEGKTRCIGVSNLQIEQLEEFHAVCPIAAFQPPYNMLQRQIEKDTLPWCREHGVSVMVYWPLLKGLLAGKLPRDHVFQPRDGRAKYPMFQGDEWHKNQDFVDRLREIAQEVGKTISQVVVNWTVHQPGITAALCGAKRAHQIEETAGAMGWRLDVGQLAKIDMALEERGEPVVKPAV
ncbi:MAG: aldo/keto reductase [Planctomycetes bacterium]|nr:aldo/keto reductase [Planctomycetota bacterium]MBL7040674.1 aldo/keto reductase [Pirellulaceae bacterium]